MTKPGIAPILLTAVIFSACGKSGVDVSNAPYEPKIAVEGFLYCGETVKNIKLMRNVPIGEQVDGAKLCLTPSGNNVVVAINSTLLKFDPQTQTYYNNQIAVGYGESYTLEVSARIDGTQLHATSTTKTPQRGFTVLNRSLGRFQYGSDSIVVNLSPSPGTSFYAFSIVADMATAENFIYDNQYTPKFDSATVAENLNGFRFQYDAMSDINSYGNNIYPFMVRGYHTWFYGSYTMIVYAGDDNFRYYLFTSTSVQEPDGNFHEPIETFEGDGIGVFASAIRDTVKFSISK